MVFSFRDEKILWRVDWNIYTLRDDVSQHQISKLSKQGYSYYTSMKLGLSKVYSNITI